MVLVTLSWQKFSKSAFYKISNTTMISETFSSMLLNPVHIHQSFNHAALQMRGKMIHNQNKEMFLQPGYLMIDKVNNVFRKLHGTGFSYKIQLDHMFQPLSSLRWQKCRAGRYGWKLYHDISVSYRSISIIIDIFYDPFKIRTRRKIYYI